MGCCSSFPHHRKRLLFLSLLQLFYNKNHLQKINIVPAQDLDNVLTLFNIKPTLLNLFF